MKQRGPEAVRTKAESWAQARAFAGFLHWMLYSLNKADPLGGYLLSMAAEHFAQRAAALKRQIEVWSHPSLLPSESSIAQKLLSAAPFLHLQSKKRRPGMPRFYIDTDDGEVVYKDVEGREHADVHASEQAALDALYEMARERRPAGDRRVFVVTVRDEQGRAIYEAELVMTGTWIGTARKSG